MTGRTSGPLDGTTNAGNDDVFVVKYNAAGQKLWTRQRGSPDYDEPIGIAVDGTGNIYVTGRTNGNLDGGATAGGSDVFVIKYNAAGDEQWTRQLRSPGTNDPGGIATDATGNIYITGFTDGSLDANTSAGGRDLFLVKYDAVGQKQWARQLGSPQHEYALGIATDGSANIYVAGYTGGALDGNTNAGNGDLLVVKYDAAGQKQWTRELGSTDFDKATAIVTDAAANVYVTGSTDGDLDGNTSAGRSDLFVVKYDTAGAKQWTRQLGSPGSEGGAAIGTDAAGNVYVTGRTDGNLDRNTNAGDGDLFVVKYNAAGQKQWTRQLGTRAEDSGKGIAVDAAGGIYVTGDTDGDLALLTSPTNNFVRVFVVKYDGDGNRL